MEQNPEHVLAEKARRGDREAFESLVQGHYRHVLALCCGMVSNLHDAQDLTQKTMLRAFGKVKTLREPEQFGNWICAIARNVCVDHLRSGRKHPRAVPEMVRAPEERRDEYDELQRAIGCLPEEMRVPLLMYYFDGQNSKAIAERLAITDSGVRQRLRYARRRLYELLTKEECHE